MIAARMRFIVGFCRGDASRTSGDSGSTSLFTVTKDDKGSQAIERAMKKRENETETEHRKSLTLCRKRCTGIDEQTSVMISQQMMWVMLVLANGPIYSVCDENGAGFNVKHVLLSEFSAEYRSPVQHLLLFRVSS